MIKNVDTSVTTPNFTQTCVALEPCIITKVGTLLKKMYVY